MSISLGNNYVIEMCLGNDEVQSLYLGSDLIWEKESEEWPGLKLTSQQDGSSIGYAITGTIDKDVYISSNGRSWTQWDGSDITLNNNEYRYIWNKKDTLNINASNNLNFIMSGSIAASGNCDSMINFNQSLLYTNYSCYYCLFKNCTSLITAPQLPSTALGYASYASMFYGCTNLIEAPELPATILTPYCYNSMFYGCTSLTAAPDLPATILEQQCYSYMFYNCTNLTSIKLCYTGSFDNNFYFWVTHVAASGTVYYNGTDTAHGNSAIPIGWNVEELFSGLKFTSQQSGSTIGYNNIGSIDKDIYTSTDGYSWTSWDGSNITLNDGEYRYIWNKKETLNWRNQCDFRFTMSGKIAASGNCNSIINFTEVKDYCYWELFYSCSSLTSAPDLPSMTANLYCYCAMFKNCSNLTKISDLPATKIYGGCYEQMFQGCTNLTTAPNLPATTLASQCYQEMFLNCTNLTTAPNLPATVLNSQCYAYMFKNCTNLTTAPNLLATTLAISCYTNMFNNCTSLTSIKLYYTGAFSSTYFSNWVYNINTTGKLYYNGSSTVHAHYAIPTHWTVQKF